VNLNEEETSMADIKEKSIPQDHGTKKPDAGKGDEVSEQDLGRVSGGLNPQPLPPFVDPDKP
jgi:hypothetical protein